MQRVLGMKGKGRYFSATQLIRATGRSALVPTSAREIDVAKERQREDRWREFRAWGVTKLVRDVYRRAKTLKPEAQVTAAVFTPPANAQRTSGRGMDHTSLPARAGRRTRIVTARAVLLGLTVTVVVNYWITYSEYLSHSSRMNISQFPLALFAVFAAVVVGNGLLRRACPSVGLARGELFLVLSMGTVAAIIPTAGVAGFLIGVMASPYYFASPENRWGEFILPHLPSWIAPMDRGKAMTWFFEGVPKGETIPWSAWVAPMFWWLLVLMTVAFVCACLMVVLRKQWIEHERLVFQLLAPVLDMTERASRGLPRFLRDRLFWMGFGVAFGVTGWNLLSHFNPQFPTIPVVGSYLPIARGFRPMDTRVNFFTLGFAYFAHVDVLFSIWFFHIVYMVQYGVLTRLGCDIQGRDNFCSLDVISSWQGFGALTFLVLSGLWMARRHLAGVVLRACGSERGADDSDEMLSYRTAVVGGLLGTAFLIAWFHRAGMDARVLALYVFATFIICVGMARIVSQTGMLYVREPLSAQVFAVWVLGSAAIAPRSMVALAMSFCIITLGRGLFLPSLAQVTKLSDSAARRSTSGAVPSSSACSSATPPPSPSRSSSTSSGSPRGAT